MANSSYINELNEYMDFKNLYSGWYFNESTGGYMSMNYFDIGKKDKRYFLSERRYTISDFNNKTFTNFSSASTHYLNSLNDIYVKYRILILNGYVNPILPHLFKENNRIKTALLETDKGYSQTIEFNDAVEFTAIEVNYQLWDK